jgi:hypothetical protein
MALSPENTRRSVQGYSPGAYIGPRPDAPIEGGHLAMIAWLYSGITYATGAPEPVGGGGGLLPIWTRRRRG